MTKVQIVVELSIDDSQESVDIILSEMDHHFSYTIMEEEIGKQLYENTINSKIRNFRNNKLKKTKWVLYKNLNIFYSIKEEELERKVSQLEQKLLVLQKGTDLVERK